ncbi:MAG: translocation/assembly module TamB domain-containing protein [Salinibacter sp.]
MPDAPDAHSDAPTPTEEGSSRLRRWARRGAWTVGLTVGAVLLLVGALLLGLQTEAGATAAARWLASTANPLPGTELTVERASGNWVRSLRLTGVTLTRPDAGRAAPVRMAHVDTLAVRYRLWPLLRGRLHVTALTADGPSVTMRQAADSTWDWARVLPATSGTPDTSAGLPIRVDRVRIEQGGVTASFYAEGRDSTARIRDLRLLAHDLRSDSTTTGRLDTLGLHAQVPGDSTDLRLGARGALSATTLTLDTLRLTSPRSQVHGHGTIRLPAETGVPVDDVALRLRATPLALRDLTPFLPTLDVDPAETIRLDLRVRGSGRRLIATVDGRFSGGGTLTARAEATPTTTTPPEGPPLRYRLDAQVRDLTTSLLGPRDSTRNRLSATATVDLTGPTLSALDGTADLRLTDTRWAGLRAPDLRLTSTLRDGTADLRLRGTLNAAQVRMTGRARPLDAAPSATLTVRVRALNLAAFVPGAGIESTLSATHEVRLRSLGTDAQTIDIDVALAPSRVGVQRIEGGQASLSLRSERAQFDGRLSLPAGTVTASGAATLDGSERFTLDRVRLDNVNLAALVGETTASRVTGTLRAEGRGFAPKTMRLDASLSLRDSFYGPYRLAALTTEATLADARLTTTTDATLNGGEWRLALNGRPFAETPIFKLARGRFTDVDLGSFLRDSTQSSTLNGTIRGTVRGLSPATMTADAELTLDSSRVNRQRIDAASWTFRLEDATLNTEFTLETPQGGTRLAVTARPFADPPTVRATNGSFDDLNVGALAGIEGLTTALSGTLTAEGRGASVEALALDAGLSFTESRINDAALTEGRLALRTEQGRVRTEGQFAVAGGQVAVSGTIDSLDATPTYTLQTTVGALDAGALAGLDSLTARVDTLTWTLDGRGLAPDALTAASSLFASGVQIGPFTLEDARLKAQYRRGQLALDTMVVRSNAVVAEGQGTLAVTDTAARSDFSLRAEVTDPGPLRDLVGAETLRLRKGVLEARIYGSSLATQRFDGEARLTNLLYDSVRLAEAEVNFSGQRGRGQLFRRLEVDGTLGYLSLPSVSAEQTRVDAVYDGTGTTVSANVRLDPTHSAALDARVRTDSMRTKVTLNRLVLQLEGDRWSLRQEATLTAGPDYRVRGLLLQSGAQQIAVDGVVDPQGTQNLVATVEKVRLGAVSSLGGLSGLDGTVSGALTLTGSAASPQLDGRLSMDLRSQDQAVGTLRLDASYQDLALGLNATLTHTDGSTLTAEGTIPMDLRLRTPSSVDVGTRPVRLDLSTDRFPLDWIDPFLDPATIRDVRGVLTADVSVRGTLEDPDLDGTASLADGGAALPSLETRYRDAAASLRFAEDQVTLEKAVLRSSNGGRLEAKGVINFPQLTVGEYDLSLKASDFIAIDTRAYRRAVIDGDMTLRGTTVRPVLTGTVQVQSGEVYYNEALAEGTASATAVSLTEEDQLTLENRFGLRLSAADVTTFDAYEAMKMDLSVRVRRDTWLRSKSTPEMNIQFTGELDLSKAADEEPRVFGSIQVLTQRSTLRQFGQVFQITEGSLTFNGDPYSPYLNLAAVYEKRARGTQGTEVRITLRLEGRPENLSPTLSSDPPMDTRNILSYLATGRPADQLLSGSGKNGNFATQVALGQASSFVENLAASELGLDVVRVQLRASGVSYLTVGRYFTPQFFVSIEQPVATSSLSDLQTTQYLPDLTLEYQLLDPLLLRARSGQQSFQLNLLFEYAY